MSRRGCRAQPYPKDSVSANRNVSYSGITDAVTPPAGQALHETAVKTETVTFRLRPEIKAALREAAEREHRRLANMLEVMILNWRDMQGARPLGAQPSEGCSDVG